MPKANIPPVTDQNSILAMRNALLAEQKGTPWVVATGPLTNIALLFATFPELAGHVQGLSIMGGAIGNGFTAAPMSRLPGDEARIGNSTVWSEFNIYVRITLPSYPRCFYDFLTARSFLPFSATLRQLNRFCRIPNLSRRQH